MVNGNMKHFSQLKQLYVGVKMQMNNLKYYSDIIRRDLNPVVQEGRSLAGIRRRDLAAKTAETDV